MPDTSARDRAIAAVVRWIDVHATRGSGSERLGCPYEDPPLTLADLRALVDVADGGTATPADPREEWTDPNRYGTCPECGSPGYDPKLMNRPDAAECINHCGTWTKPDADPAVTEALDFWHRMYRDEHLARIASDPDDTSCPWCDASKRVCHSLTDRTCCENCTDGDMHERFPAEVVTDVLDTARATADARLASRTPGEPRERQDEDDEDLIPPHGSEPSIGVRVLTDWVELPHTGIEIAQSGAAPIGIWYRRAASSPLAVPPLRGDSAQPAVKRAEVAEKANEHARRRLIELLQAAKEDIARNTRLPEVLERLAAHLRPVPAHPGVARPEPGALAPCGKCRWTQPYISITHGCPVHDDDDGTPW